DQFNFYQFISRRYGTSIIRTKDDLAQKGKKFLLSLEGTDVLRDAYDLYLAFDLGLRNLGLTWNYDTKFAASCMSRKDYGLTGSGSEIVEIANSLGIIIDLAHSSKQTVLDVCSITSKPVIVSHGNVKKIQDHPRNLDDAAIDAIVSTGGIIGITAIVTTLGGDKSIAQLVKHASYIGENFGWDHVALGTDFLGINEVPSGFEGISKLKDLSTLLGDHSSSTLWDNPIRVIQKNLNGNNGKQSD
ncbi:MAG: membrane dipeptidase, partial [Thermoplasmataceae archaeon]